MIEIINNILSSSGYKQVDIEPPYNDYDIYLYCPSEAINREEYFVTLQLHAQSDEAAKTILLEKAQILFEEISNSGQVSRPFEKNCTMFICHEEDKINRQTILALEEDPYNFKKNVITYTQPELEALLAYLAENKIESITNAAINNIINSEEGRGFLEFKDSHKSSKSLYSLVLRTTLKLPFVTYHPQEQKLSNLSLEIRKSLSQDQNSIFSQLLDSELELTDENIHKQIERIWSDLG